MNKKQLGHYGEWLAKNYLAEKGYKVLATNYRVHQQGEIDLVCEKDERLVFVEVKTRTNQNFGFPEQAVSKNKINHLVYASLDYLEKNNFLGSWQIDVISVLISRQKNLVEIKHFENVSANLF